MINKSHYLKKSYFMGRLCARKRKGEMDKLQHEIKGGGVRGWGWGTMSTLLVISLLSNKKLILLTFNYLAQ